MIDARRCPRFSKHHRLMRSPVRTTTRRHRRTSSPNNPCGSPTSSSGTRQPQTARLAAEPRDGTPGRASRPARFLTRCRPKLLNGACARPASCRSSRSGADRFEAQGRWGGLGYLAGWCGGRWLRRRPA